MDLHGLTEQLQRGGTLLVPTQRAARAWQQRLFDHARHTALPTVLPWGAWTAARWQTLLLDGREDRVLLNARQNTELWKGTLEAASPGTLRPVHSLVRLCTAAQHLVHTHGATDRLLAFHGDPETDIATFAGWFRAYTQRCAQERLLPASALDDVLARHAANAGPQPALFLLGFDSLLPAQQRLLDSLAAAGTAVETLDTAALLGLPPASPILLRCADATHEWESLAAALRTHAEQPAETTPADAAVLLVLPDAEASRAALDRTLRSAFPNGTPWEFAAGRSLRSLPLTATALQLLQWTQLPQTADSVGALLQSPYLNLRIDPHRAAEVDADTLRDNRRLRPEWSIGALAHRLGERESALREALFALQATAGEQLRGEHLHGDWAARVHAVLHAAGWPGQRERNSVEFQLTERWNDLLDALASLDLFEQPVPFRVFLQDLTAAADETLFAAQNTGAPIQIVSPAEAAGTVGDTLWFAHATESAWNGRRHASPLLPWALQVECGMPGTDPAADADLHRRITERLLQSAAHVTASYAATSADGDMRPAAIVEELHAEPQVAPALPGNDASLALETFPDTAPLPGVPQGVVHGGVGVLKDQAACAFRAFAERRLFSSEPQTGALGYDAAQRGELLHKVLQLFWNEVKTQKELLSRKAGGTLEATLRAHIDAVLPPPAGADPFNTAYVAVQRRRLQSLLLRWLEMEARRPDFRVRYTEHEVKGVPVGPLHFNLRVDRVDEVDREGEPTLVLIDYKTGTPRTSEWTGPRPGEPQLPLYAVAAGLDSVGAIAFATVRPGEKSLGLSSMPASTELLFQGKSDKHPEAFDQQMEEWYGTLQRLGEEFARGDATVGPKQYPATCTFCGQRMLCRLNPDLLEQAAEEEHA